MKLSYFSGGKNQTLQFKSLGNLAAPTAQSVARRGPASVMASAEAMVSSTVSAAADSLQAIKTSMPHLHEAWNSLHETDARYMIAKDGKTMVMATDSITVEGLTMAKVKHLRDKFGFEVIREGLQGKLLLRSAESNDEAFAQGKSALEDLKAHGHTLAAHPHFIRTFIGVGPSAAGGQPLWNHDNTGNPGVPGADVAARAAWLITKGDKTVRVAILDEGVDSLHPALKDAIVAEKDYVAGNSHARPDGNDAHGTCCAGIIGSQDATYPGLASGCSLIAVRIAKGDGRGGWIVDDFNSADAIDWAWEEGEAHVLSNSWGGGPPVDGIANAIARATTQGRKGKGSIVVFATGNTNGPVNFPATLETVIAVGASTPWDDRKSPTTKDDETNWGSCFGKELNLLAPGVKIATTDISGPSGYTPDNFTTRFNGTSSATPHVAAAAALILSVAPTLTATRVREILTSTCDKLNPDGKWSKEVGHGRLNIFNALRLARR